MINLIAVILFCSIAFAFSFVGAWAMSGSITIATIATITAWSIAAGIMRNQK